MPRRNVWLPSRTEWLKRCRGKLKLKSMTKSRHERKRADFREGRSISSTKVRVWASSAISANDTQVWTKRIRCCSATASAGASSLCRLISLLSAAVDSIRFHRATDDLQ